MHKRARFQSTADAPPAHWSAPLMALQRVGGLRGNLEPVCCREWHTHRAAVRFGICLALSRSRTSLRMLCCQQHVWQLHSVPIHAVIFFRVFLQQPHPTQLTQPTSLAVCRESKGLRCFRPCGSESFEQINVYTADNGGCKQRASDGHFEKYWYVAGVNTVPCWPCLCCA